MQPGNGHVELPEGAVRSGPEVDPRQQKRERILATAGRLFFEGGYRATSMESIAEQLGVTKPFLYYHFENKHEILEELARRVVAMARAVLELPESGDGCPERALAGRVRGYVRIVHAHRPLLMVLFRETSSFSDGTRALLVKEEAAHVAQLAALLAQGTQSGAFRVAEPSLTAAAILSFVGFGGAFGGALDLPSHEAIEEHHVALALRMVGAQR